LWPIQFKNFYLFEANGSRIFGIVIPAFAFSSSLSFEAIGAKKAFVFAPDYPRFNHQMLPFKTVAKLTHAKYGTNKKPAILSIFLN